MSLSLLAAGIAALSAPFSALSALLLITRAPTPPYLPSAALSWLLAGWLLWPVATLLWSDAMALALQWLAAILALPLGWLSGLSIAQRGELKDRLSIAVAALIPLFVCWAIWQGPNTYTSKPQGPFNDPNAFAAILNLLLLPLLGRYLVTDLATITRYRRVAWLALLGAALLVLALIASRGATLALLLVLPVLLWAARHQPQFRRKLAVLTVAALAAYTAGTTVLQVQQVQQAGEGALTRLTNTVQQGDATRVQLYRAAWAMIQDHPWLGTGLGSFRLRYGNYRDPAEIGTAGGWVHNDYLQLWLEAGLPMLLLLLALCAWVGWRGVQALRSGGARGVEDLGYVAALAAVLLHALVNFLLYMPLIMLLMGLYLARLSPAPVTPPAEPARALRLAAAGYALIAGLLLAGLVAVEGLLGQAQVIQRTLLPWGIAYPRYEVAWWLSVLSPWHPVPQQVMGQELADLARLNPDPEVVAEAARRMRMAWERIPCYLPLANDAYRLLDQPGTPTALHAQGLTLAREALRCNPRHGLTHYYAGRFEDTPETARRWWQQGLERSLYVPERLLLTAALLRQELPQSAARLDELTELMAAHIARLEANPGLRADATFWSEIQYRLWHLGGRP